MSKIRAAITGVGGFVPEYRLTNNELSKMVATSSEWIMSRIGIEERRILKEEGKATSDLATEAIKQLLEKTNTNPTEIDILICATVTPDMQFPATANIISDKVGLINAFSFDISAGCSGFLFALNNASKYIETGSYKKIIVVGAEKMSSIVDYTDRNTSPIFGDGAGAVLLEPNTEGQGVIDSILKVDGGGRKHLHKKAGGSLKPSTHETIDAREEYIYQEGRQVFKHAIINMADVSIEIMQKHKLTSENIAWFVPHQANMRIIDASAKRIGLPKEKIMINIQKYGNTTAATIPLCLLDYEKKLKKNDNLIIATFGAGFTWGSMYLKWAY